MVLPAKPVDSGMTGFLCRGTSRILFYRWPLQLECPAHHNGGRGVNGVLVCIAEAIR